MLRYDPARESTGRSIGRFMTRWSLRYAIALVLVAATACASRGDLTSAPLSEAGESVIGAGYRFIGTRYIRPVPIRSIALLGLRGVSTIDPQAQAYPMGGKIAIEHNGKILAILDQPRADDSRGWAGVTVRSFESAGKRSAKIRNAQPEEVYRAVFRAALSSLDRYSRYSTPAEAREIRVLREGYGGIGVTIRAEKGVTRIISVMAGTPGHKAGLKDGDIITAIAGIPTKGMSLNKVVRQLRGPRGSQVRLTVRRSAGQRLLTVNVTRAFIVPQTVMTRRTGNAIYLQITRFSDDTASKAAGMVARWRTRIGKRKLNGAIIDLRNNPGGLLDQAIRISDLFLDDGDIMETRGRHPESRRRYAARYGDVLRGKPIVVLVNGPLRLVVGDPRRRAAGQWPSRDCRQQFLRQGHGAERCLAAKRRPNSPHLVALPCAFRLQPAEPGRAAEYLHKRRPPEFRRCTPRHRQPDRRRDRIGRSVPYLAAPHGADCPKRPEAARRLSGTRPQRRDRCGNGDRAAPAGERPLVPAGPGCLGAGARSRSERGRTC